jgi:putative tricarboxylic transport membrane protein
MMIPANPGGGWDTTGPRAGQGAAGSRPATTVTYENKGGAAGAIGLAQFVNASKGDPNALMVMGAVMLGGIITGKPPVSLTQATPLARLTSEYNVFVLPANSPFEDHGRRRRADEEGPRQREVGRRFARVHRTHRRGHDRARSGRGPDKINYVPFRGGGEATAAILGGNVTGGRQRLQRVPSTSKAARCAPSASPRARA